MKNCTPQGNREIAVIAAVARNGVIGSQRGMPWHIPEDLRRFRAITSGHTVIMGRRTWESVGAALPNRQNIVVSRGLPILGKDVELAESFNRAVELARLPNPVFIIGGERLYRAALKIARYLYLTEIHRDFEGEAFFPKLEHATWIEVFRQPNTTGEFDKMTYDFVEYVRREGVSVSNRTPFRRGSI